MSSAGLLRYGGIGSCDSSSRPKADVYNYRDNDGQNLVIFNYKAVIHSKLR